MGSVKRLADEVARDWTGVRRFAHGVITTRGIVHEDGHPAPWILAMDAAPPRAECAR
jgi:hypothetical protein